MEIIGGENPAGSVIDIWQACLQQSRLHTVDLLRIYIDEWALDDPCVHRWIQGWETCARPIADLGGWLADYCNTWFLVTKGQARPNVLYTAVQNLQYHTLTQLILPAKHLGHNAAGNIWETLCWHAFEKGRGVFVLSVIWNTSQIRLPTPAPALVSADQPEQTCMSAPRPPSWFPPPPSVSPPRTFDRSDQAAPLRNPAPSAKRTTSSAKPREHTDKPARTTKRTARAAKPSERTHKRARTAKRTASAAKPSKLTDKPARTAKRIASAAKPGENSVKPAHSAKRTASYANISEHNDKPARTAKRAASSAQAIEHTDSLLAKDDACSSYQSHQARLHSMSEKMQEIWFTVFDSHETPATIQISWTSCWSKLESILKAIVLDFLQGNILDLSAEPREKLTDVLEMLKAKLIYHHPQTVLQNKSRQMLECFTNLMQKASDLSTWQTILDELLCDSHNSAQHRSAQFDLLKKKPGPCQPQFATDCNTSTANSCPSTKPVRI